MARLCKYDNPESHTSQSHRSNFVSRVTNTDGIGPALQLQTCRHARLETSAGYQKPNQSAIDRAINACAEWDNSDLPSEFKSDADDATANSTIKTTDESEARAFVQGDTGKKIVPVGLVRTTPGYLDEMPPPAPKMPPPPPAINVQTEDSPDRAVGGESHAVCCFPVVWSVVV